MPSLRQRAQDAEELVGLLRRQHAGRLVEDQDPGAAIRATFRISTRCCSPDRQIADERVGIDVQAVVARQPLQLGARRGEALARSSGAALGAEHDVLQHGEILHQHEMLVHHADAVRRWRRAGCAMRTGLPSMQDLAAVGLVEAVEDAHQRRFAGAVLADDAGDRALARS